MTKIAILVSGSGTNMEALAMRVKSKDLQAQIAFVASDKPDAPALSKAGALGISTEVLPYPKGRGIAESYLNDLFKKHKLDYLVLAGFMKILSPGFTKSHKDKIINIHPTLLPSFPGAHGIEDAWNYGVKVTGVTIHIVDEKVDHGRILSQKAVTVEDDDSLESLEEKIHREEHELYWTTLKRFFAGEIKERKDV